MDSTDDILASQGVVTRTERTPGSHNRAIALGTAACLGLLCVGYEQAVALYDGVESGWRSDVTTLAYVAGAVVAALVGDAAGRKVAIVMGSLLFALGLWVVALVRNRDVVLLGHVVQNIGSGMYVFIVPLYCVEVAAKENRGLLAGIAQLLYGSGYFLGAYVASETEFTRSWDLATYVVPQAPMLVLALACVFLPDSPRWTHVHKGKELAEIALKRIRNTWLVQTELSAIAAQATAVGDTTGWRTLADFSVLARIGVFSVLLVFQLLFASIVSTSFEALVALSEPEGFAASIFGDFKLTLFVVNVFGALPALYLVDAVGRRSLLILGTCGMILGHIVTAVAVVAGCDRELEDRACTRGSAIGFFIGTMVLLVSNTVCWTPVLWLYPVEVFPTSVRAKASAIVAVLSGVSIFWVRELFPKVVEYAAASMLLSLLALLLVLTRCPETARLLLEDVEELVPRGFHSKNQRNTLSTEITTVTGRTAAAAV